MRREPQHSPRCHRRRGRISAAAGSASDWRSHSAHGTDIPTNRTAATTSSCPVALTSAPTARRTARRCCSSLTPHIPLGGGRAVDTTCGRRSGVVDTHDPGPGGPAGGCRVGAGATGAECGGPTVSPIAVRAAATEPGSGCTAVSLPATHASAPAGATKPASATASPEGSSDHRPPRFRSIAHTNRSTGSIVQPLPERHPSMSSTKTQRNTISKQWVPYGSVPVH